MYIDLRRGWGDLVSVITGVDAEVAEAGERGRWRNEGSGGQRSRSGRGGGGGGG